MKWTQLEWYGYGWFIYPKLSSSHLAYILRLQTIIAWEYLYALINAATDIYLFIYISIYSLLLVEWSRFTVIISLFRKKQNIVKLRVISNELLKFSDFILELVFTGTFGCHRHTFYSRSLPSTAIPAILAGLLGVGGLDVAYADSNEVSMHYWCWFLSIGVYVAMTCHSVIMINQAHLIIIMEAYIGTNDNTFECRKWASH